MGRVRAGTIGILPAGALGVSFFYHLTGRLKTDDGAVVFLDRQGSKSAEALRDKGEFTIADETQRYRVRTGERCVGSLFAQFDKGTLPEVLLLCPNPDQLPGILHTVVQLLERMGEQGELTADFDFPILVLASNGIYYQRLRQQFVEQLEEATLLGRLPDLWPDIMPRIVGRLLRGVTIQTGIRDGSGADAIYHPGPSGITRVAGGDAAQRLRAVELLRQRGGWFELAPHSSATRLEFDKAIVNLTTNLLGQFHVFGSDGSFIPLRVRDLLAPKHMPAIRELARRVFEVGQAVRVYGPDENFEKLLSSLLATSHQHDDHIPSSLQWIGLRLRQGQLAPELTPTEEWLLNPLIRYAHAAGLHDAGHYFETLKEKAIANLAAAASR